LSNKGLTWIISDGCVYRLEPPTYFSKKKISLAKNFRETFI